MPMLFDRHVCRCAEHARRDGFASKSAKKHYAPDLRIEPVHLDIDLRVDPASETARGTVTTTVVARVDGPRTLTLDAVDFLDVKVTDPDGGEVEHTYDGQKLKVTWDEAFQAGDERRVAVTYRVEQPVSGLFFSHPTSDYPDRPHWAATDHETERARHWLPCIDHLNVRTTLSFHLRTNAAYHVLANGTLVETEEHDDDTKTAHWELDFPCPSYLVCFALGELTEARDGEFEGIPVAYYGAKHHPEEHLMRSFGRTRDMLAWMTDKLRAPFPFPKYYQFALPSFGGAMENISLVSWDDIFVLNEDFAREWTWLVDQVNVHEMAHSYFGDAVVCRDFSHVWLKESWATYMEQCWLEDRYGADERDYDFYRNSRAYFEESDDNYARPIVTREFDSSWDMFDRHLYPGGACRLHMLRHEIGTDVFWAAVADYIDTYSGSVVETDDFRRILEAHSGKSLGRFFDQWFRTAGYPKLEASFAWDAEKKEGTFTIEQKQVSEKEGDDEGPEFFLTLTLGWGADGVEHTEEVQLDRAKRTYRFTMEKEPDVVRIDPENTVLFGLDFNPGDQKLRKQLTGAPDVVGRILAAHELAKTGRQANVQAVVDAWDAEEFWGVRQQFAVALAKANTRVALDGLLLAVEKEEDPMVLGKLFQEVAKFRDPAIAEAVMQRIENGDLTPWATYFAWTVIGAQREDADVQKIAAAARRETWHDIARNGALVALGKTRQEAAMETMMGVATRGMAETRARVVAARELGKLGAMLEKRDRERVREFLEDLLLDDDISVARAAASGLAAMKAVESIDRIEALQRRLPHQESVSVRRLVEGLHKSGQPKVASLERQLEDLRAEYRKLEGRLEKLEN